MYFNIFKRNWMNETIVEFMKTLPQGFVPFIVNGDTSKKQIFFDNDLYNCRNVSYIGIYFMDECTAVFFSVNNILTNYDVSIFRSVVDPFIDTYKFEKQQPAITKLIEIEQMSKQRMIKEFNISTDITEHLPDVLTINLNSCGSTVKNKLIEYLNNVNENSVPVDIQIDFSHTPLEELQEHETNVLLATATTGLINDK